MGSWNAKVYINDIYRDTIKIDNKDSLDQIRKNYKYIIPNDGQEYYFTFKNKNIIEKNEEKNYKASQIYYEENSKEYRISLKSKLYHEGKVVDIYINDDLKDTIKLKGNLPSLGQLRDSCKDIIPNNEKYYFLSKNNQIIKLEDNYNIFDVLKKDEDKDKYRIDFKTIDFYENKALLINVYLNELKNSAVFIERNSDLRKVKKKLNDRISFNDNIYFATSTDFLIKNNIEDFKIENIIITEGKEKKYLYVRIKLL